jgi:hypothetical protein
LTVTLKLPFAVLPAPSVALQLTVVVPIGNVDPDEGEQLTATLPETASLADAENVTTAPLLELADVLMSAGRLKAGGVVSTTVIVNDPFDELVELSVAVQLTVVAPSANVEPDAGLQLTTGAGSVSSVALAV